MSAIHPFDRGSYLVQSTRHPEDWYVADVEEGTCPCRHGETRPDGKPARCKHMRRARALHRLLSFHQSPSNDGQIAVK